MDEVATTHESVSVGVAFGFLAMGTRVAGSGKDAGAFYTYVSRGLGKPAGLGAAFLCGLFLAMRWRKFRPDLYARTGRDC